jgi:hypothetical protein
MTGIFEGTYKKVKKGEEEQKKKEHFFSFLKKQHLFI